MFMAAGLIAQALGHDRIAGLAGIGRALPVTLLAFGLGGLSLMGLPPSGGFAAKWLLLSAAIASGQWWWGLVIVGGGLLTGGYVFRVLGPAMASPEAGAPPLAPVARGREMVVLALAVVSMALGLLPFASFDLLQVGTAESGDRPVSAAAPDGRDPAARDARRSGRHAAGLRVATAARAHAGPAGARTPAGARGGTARGRRLAGAGGEAAYRAGARAAGGAAARRRGLAVERCGPLRANLHGRGEPRHASRSGGC